MRPQQLTLVSDAAQKFSKLFYETYDKDRNKLKTFYLENAQLVWNGNSVANLDNILTFLNALPSSTIELLCLDAQVSDFATDCMDALSTGLMIEIPCGGLEVITTVSISPYSSQPVDDAVTDKKTTMMVTAQGKIKFHGRSFVAFNETFIMTENEQKWKIVSDIFRSQDDSLST